MVKRAPNVPVPFLQWYDKEKAAYDAFLAQKLEKVRKSKEQALEKSKEHKGTKLHKARIEKLMSADRFLNFSSKHHPNHPAYANHIKEQSLKKQKRSETSNEKHGFNSPTPRDKENIT